MKTSFGANDDWAYRHVVLFLAKRSGREPESISLDENVPDLLGDSLDIVEFVMAMEDEFGLELPDDNGPLHTVRDLIEWVRRHQR